jgi:hypothetical protein
VFKRINTVLALTAAPVLLAAGQAAAAAHQAGPAGVAHAPQGPAVRSAGPLRVHPFQPEFRAPAVTGPTVAHYSSSFSYAGKTYTYASVGTDPRTSAASTTVPVTFIPVKIVEASGAYSYPTTAVTSTTGSALFKNSSATGSTQYGDATLRASFWKYVSSGGGKWHVRLGTPATKALLTIKVPSTQGSYYIDGAGGDVMTVNDNWFGTKLSSIAASYPATNLVIFLTYDTVGCSDYTNLNTCGTGGFHSAKATSTGTHTFSWASWMDAAVFGASGADTAAMSHEIAEWLNDPFVNDIVPSWSVPSEPQYGCSNYFEVGDPLVGHVFTVGGLHFQDEANFSWFARQSPSIGQNGRYSYKGTFTTYSPVC